MGLVHHWSECGLPLPTRGHASFPDWSNTIGGIVECAGYKCPLEAPKVEGAADVVGQDMRSLVEAIADGATLRSVDFEELVDICRTRGIFDNLVADIQDKSNRSRLASILRSYDGRLVGGFRFNLLGRGHNRRFQAEIVASA